MDTEDTKAELNRIFGVLRILEVQIVAGERELVTLTQLHRDYVGIVDQYATEFVEFVRAPITDLTVYREAVVKLDHYHSELRKITSDLTRRASLNASQMYHRAALKKKYSDLSEKLENTGAKLLEFKGI